MVLALEAPALRAWRRRDRWAWSTLYATGLIEEGEAETVRSDPQGLELERVALWSSDAPPPEADATHADTEILERACERALARQRTRSPRAAVFVDRDGTLVVERGYLSDPLDLELLPRTVTALRHLRAAGFPVVVVSNQSGVERGLFPASRVYAAMARLRSLLRVHGIELDAVYFCPHRPEAGCACRKPGTALLERAADDLVLALARSFMAGDKMLDVETARRAHARGVLVRTGYGRDEERRLAGGGGADAPDLVCEDLEAAARWIVTRQGTGED
ncbi:MAG: HAD family hydrolase [Candidatus Eisenbacteria bacterium]|nr:HAD family hydrolase [Candidatus Eisenbacteria bacterium]